MNHIERAHFRDTFVYKCPVCGSSPTTRHALECHMREKHNKSRKDWSGLDVVKTNDFVSKNMEQAAIRGTAIHEAAQIWCETKDKTLALAYAKEYKQWVDKDKDMP